MDTLKAYEKLRTKFDEGTARVLVDTLGELASPPLAGLASKEDVALAKAELRTEIQAAKVETIRWVMGAALGQVIAVIGLVGAVLALIR